MQEANNDCTYHGCGAIAIIFVPLSKLRSLNVKDNFNNTFSVKSFLTPPLWPRNSGANLTQNNQITKQTTTNPYYFLRHTYGKRSTSGKENCKSGTLPGCLATYLFFLSLNRNSELRSKILSLGKCKLKRALFAFPLA